MMAGVDEHAGGVAGLRDARGRALLISFRKSTPPQKRQLNILIRNSNQSVDDFVGELTFQD